MNALGAAVGFATGSSLFIDCAALFRGPRNLRTLALGGAGVFAFDGGAPLGTGLSAADCEGLVVLADARIDDRQQLGCDLALAAQDAASLSAAELIARAWRRWGADAPARLVGDYAFMVWDTADQSLSLVRDFYGERPLHYRCVGQGLLAASLPSALAAAAGSARVDLFTLARYHALLPQTGPESFFEGVARVEPGTVVRWRSGRVDIRRYWSPPRGSLDISRDEAAEEVSAILDRAVRDRAAGAAGVAAHLSAGMDSSAVVAALGDAGIAATAITGEAAQRDEAPAGFVASEAPVAAATAALHPSLRHVIARPDGRSIAELMDDFNHSADQPIRSIDNGDWLDATYREAAQAKASVLMTGSFGNNSFSHDGSAYFGELLRGMRVLGLIREGREFRRTYGARWRGVAALALGPVIPGRLWRWYRRSPQWREALVERTLFRREHPVLDRLRARAAEDRHDLAERPIATTWHARAQEIRWVDNGLFDYRPRHRWGVTITDPMADRRLVEFTLRLPGHHWLEQGRTRAVARRVLRGRVAPDVIDPRGRGMQGSGWRRAAEACLPQLRGEVDRLARTPWGELLDTRRVAAMLDGWPESGWSDHEQLFLYRATLLRAISLGHFARVRSA